MLNTSKIESTELIQLIIDGIQDKKGRHITHIDLRDNESAAASHFIICEGTTPTQVSAIADNIREHLLEKARIKPYNYDGYQNSKWIVIDYGDTLVHIFVPVERTHYNLEELWNDAILTEIPDID